MSVQIVETTMEMADTSQTVRPEVSSAELPVTVIRPAGNSVVGSEKLITKIYFPRLAIPLAAVGAAVVDFLIAFSLMIGIMAWYRVGMSAAFLMVPVFFATMLMLAVGVGALLA